MTFTLSNHMMKLPASIFLLSLLFFGPALELCAQNRNDYGSVPRQTLAESRAEREAEQRVSLSADKIIQILQQEPGLLLQVKKMLVRKAYEQGRLLDPADLTDEALFRLLREDQNICILATHELEDRSYIRPKPTREELERERDLAAQKGLTPLPLPSTPLPASAQTVHNQEDAYWVTHERDFENYTLPNNVPSNQSPSSSKPAPSIQEIAPQNPARTLNRASLNGQNDDDGFDDLGQGITGLSRINPDQLSQVLGGGSSPALLAAGLSQMQQGDNQPNLSQLKTGPSLSLPTSLPGLGGDLQDQIPNNTQQASFTNPQRAFPSPLNQGEARPVFRHRPNPYANVPALFDLYSQASKKPPALDRFGMDIFVNGTGNMEQLPMDLPAGPEYVLGPGDGLSIDLWGSVSRRLRRVVDREGRVALPEAGMVQVSGRSLGDVQHMVQSALRTQFHDIEADVSLARIRTVRVYVVGDVMSPGAYDISSLSTPLNALYAAGGPTARGSLRHLRHFRGKQLLEEVDAYDLLLHGIHSELTGIQSGDTILVPPVGPQVIVQGMVRRPAIYELGEEKTLSEVLELSGGVLPSGTLRHVDVERLVAHEKRTMLRLDLPESNDEQAVNKALNDFQMQDGDHISISPILPYADQTVYLDGHVFRPGKYPFRDGMKITDVVRSYKELLPEPSIRHAEIIRLQPPDYTPVVLAFNLSDALEGKDQNLVLKPFDTIRIFGRYDFEDPPVITVSGEVRDPGDHVTNGTTHLRDAVYLAGGVTPEAELQDVQIFRHSVDGKLRVISVNLAKALTGEQADDVLLEPKDRVFIHRNLGKTDPAAVTIQGEVGRPGKYPLGDGMTAAELVHLAGGFKRSADAQSADLTRYLEQDGTKRIGEQHTVDLAKAMTSSGEADPTLRDGDVLTIPQIAGWNDVGASVTIKGEVMRAGTYGIHEGERLSSVLARAGGFRSDAYPYGAILERAQVRELQEKNQSDLIRRVQSEGNALKLIPETDADQKMAKEASLAQWQTALDKLQNTPPSGRLVLHISNEVKRWANTPADLQVRAGDVLIIPKQPNFVMVNGSVYNPTAITFRPGKSAEWYLRQAGGPTQMANKKAIFVVRANGSVVGGSGSMFGGGGLSTELRPGDLVMVPEKAMAGTSKWKTTLEASQLVYSIGVAIQVAKSF